MNKESENLKILTDNFSSEQITGLLFGVLTGVAITLGKDEEDYISKWVDMVVVASRTPKEG